MSKFFEKLRIFRTGDDGSTTKNFEGCQHHEARKFSSECDEEELRTSFADEDEQARLKKLFEHFLNMEGSLQKYWKTCTAFLQVSGLVQEGIDQMTADVLTYCSSMEENRKVMRLENEALRVRDAMPCEEVVNEGIRKHLLGPMGDRLKTFQEIKERAKAVKRMKGEYYEKRRMVNKLRIDRSCDRACLKLEEGELANLAARLDSAFKSLLADLDKIYANRAEILKEPFDALRLCQADFLEHVSHVLRGHVESPQSPPEQVQTTTQPAGQLEKPHHGEDHHQEQLVEGEAKPDEPVQMTETRSGTKLRASRQSHQPQIYSQNHHQQYNQQYQHEIHANSFNHTSRDIPQYYSNQYTQQEETETVMTTNSMGTGQRHLVAKIVKDFHALKGRRIFERPPQFRTLKVAQHHSYNRSQLTHQSQSQSNMLQWEDPSTYERVRKFSLTVLHQTRQTQRKIRQQPMDEWNAATVLQSFWKTLLAQREARSLASQIVSVNVDQSTGYPFYSNPYTGYMSWHPSLFSPRE